MDEQELKKDRATKTATKMLKEVRSAKKVKGEMPEEKVNVYYQDYKTKVFVQMHVGEINVVQIHTRARHPMLALIYTINI